MGISVAVRIFGFEHIGTVLYVEPEDGLLVIMDRDPDGLPWRELRLVQGRDSWRRV